MTAENFPSATLKEEDTFLEVNKEVSQEEDEKKTPKMFSYGDAVRRYRELKEVLPEAEQIRFDERPPRNRAERILRRYTMRHEAILGQAEACAQSGNPHAEKANRMLAQMLEAQMTILGLYFDNLQEEENSNIPTSSEFLMSNLIAEDNPWIGKAVEEDRKETLSQEQVEA